MLEVEVFIIGIWIGDLNWLGIIVWKFMVGCECLIIYKFYVLYFFLFVVCGDIYG